jgi:hypothetical protein
MNRCHGAKIGPRWALLRPLTSVGEVSVIVFIAT